MTKLLKTFAAILLLLPLQPLQAMPDTSQQATSDSNQQAMPHNSQQATPANSLRQLQVLPIDSLIALLPTLPHDSLRLEVLHEITLSLQHTPAQETYARQLIAEAELQHNDSQLCAGLYLLMLYYYNNTDDTDSLLHWLSQLKPVALRIQDYRDYFDGKKLVINNYIYSQQYEYAIVLAEEMAHEAEERAYIDGTAAAYFCLANAYNETGRLKEESQALQQVHRLFPLLHYSNIKLGTTELLIEHAHRTSDTTALGTYLNEYEALLDECEAASAERASIYSLHRLYAAAYRIYYHTMRQEFKEVERHMAQVEHLTADEPMHPYQLLAMDALQTYYLATGLPEIALLLNDSVLLHLMNEEGYATSIVRPMRRRGEILNQLGEYERALSCYERSVEIQDSINLEISAKQVAEFHRLHHLDILLQHQQELKEREQWILLSLCLLLIILCLVYYRHIQRLNQALFQAKHDTEEALQCAQRANETKSIFLADLRQHISKPIHAVVALSKQLAANPRLTDEERAATQQTITRYTQQLIRLINGVLDLSRLEAGMTKWQLAPCDLLQTLRQAIDEVQLHHPEIQINYHSQVEQWPVQTDPKRLMQLFSSCLYLPYAATHPVPTVEVTPCAEGIKIRITPSPLADAANRSEESTIRHDINRRTLLYFGGSYRVSSEEESTPWIEITYPKKRE